jgi:hypothetical protein
MIGCTATASAHSSERPMSAAYTNKRVVTDYVGAFNTRNYDKLRRLFARHAIIYGVPGKGGLEAVMPIWKELHSGLDVQLHVDEMVAEGDAVAVRYTERGRFVGFLSRPCAHRAIVRNRGDGMVHRA